jgi:hypothetical protein
MIEDAPVVVAAFRLAEEASRARSFLLQEKIAANMTPRQEGIERLCPDLFDGGFDVLVSRENAADAIALLQRIWPEARANDAPIIERCPACGSTDVGRVRKIRILIIATIALLAGSFMFGEKELFLLAIGIVAAAVVLTPGRHCRACDERWG